MFDSKGFIVAFRSDLDEMKSFFASHKKEVSFEEAFKGADVFFGLSRGGLVNKEMIKKMAKDIRDKYIDPPNTTDFGIMFLPIEGLFAEVVRQPDMIAFLQREYKIVVTGPTTLAAMLNSLQMGFKTLAIQKRSSEVWNVLASVKKEFNTFGGVLEKAQKKLNEANNEIENLVGTRTRIMQSKLKNVEQLELPENAKEESNLLDIKE